MVANSGINTKFCLDIIFASPINQFTYWTVEIDVFKLKFENLMKTMRKPKIYLIRIQ